ncbi:MAG: Uma2 family endonuclease [Actinobacteria bacterium]|nr:Uma2 family endonuclease [Actinomycetota bacterium]
MTVTVAASKDQNPNAKPDPSLGSGSGLGPMASAKAPPRAFTASDLDTMGDDGYRREVIEGRLIVTPSPISRHQDAVGSLFLLLGHHRPDGFRVMIAPLDWRTSGGNSLQPDLMVIGEEDYNPDGFQLATPLLVVEVLSPSTMIYDKGDKLRIYETLGVQSYWIVDPATPSLIALQLRDGSYVEVAQVTGSQTYEADLPYPVPVAPADLIR